MKTKRGAPTSADLQWASQPTKNTHIPTPGTHQPVDAPKVYHPKLPKYVTDTSPCNISRQCNKKFVILYTDLFERTKKRPYRIEKCGNLPAVERNKKLARLQRQYVLNLPFLFPKKGETPLLGTHSH